MEEQKKKRKYKRRGPRQKKTKKQILKRVVSDFVLIVALIVFVVSAMQLLNINKGYKEGEKEYDEIKELAITAPEKEHERFKVDFNVLQQINPDVVAWIRFEAPEVISYPVVQGSDNDEYLYRTFKGYDNTVGTIFVNAYNNADFHDRNTIIYGHYMYNGTMFNELDSYADKEFWEAHPYFYIYTPDGAELKYHIYSAGVVKDTSESYTYQFADDVVFSTFLDITKGVSNYETGVPLDVDDEIVTLSTCTKDNNDDRFVVHAVKVEENFGE